MPSPEPAFEPLETGPRSPKGRRTRARLIEAGQTVFERDGFFQARITDIAAEAGVSHGAFYHYFSSKEELFREMAEAVEVRLVSMDDVTHPAGSSPGPLERIRAANRSYLLAYAQEAGIMRVIEEVSRYDPDVRKVRSERDQHLTARLEAAIRRLQRDGQADARIDRRYAAMALGGMVARFAEQMFVAGGDFDPDVAVEQLTLLWANALGIPAATQEAEMPAPRRRRRARK